MPEQSPDINARRYAREVIASQLDYRREKLWRVFSWTSSLLVGITAGVIAIENQTGVDLSAWNRLLLSFASLTVGLFSALWLLRNLAAESEEKSLLRDVESELGLPSLRSSGIGYGYLITVLLLNLAALLSIWLSRF